MTNTPQTPARIAHETQLKFRIPLYQRPYAWTPLQVGLLLEDLWGAFVRDSNANYHIGIMSIADSGDGSGTWDIIDGQQRMTTLILIGWAAAEHHDPAWTHHAPGWMDFLTNDRLALYGRTSDQATLLNPKNSPGTVMGRAYLCAKEFLANKPGEFGEFIFKRTAFFVSPTPNDYSVVEKNQQFVRLNNRGKQLERHEILKVRLSSLIGDLGDLTTFLRQWNNMLDCLSEHPVANSGSELEVATLGAFLEDNAPNDDAAKERLYSAIVSVPEFLLIALARLTRSPEIDMKPDNLLNTFLCLESEAVLQFGKVLEMQTCILRKSFIFITKSGRTAYELGLEEWSKVGAADDFSALIVTQSFLHVSRRPHEWLIPAFDWCAEQGGAIDPSRFQDALERIDSNILENRTLPSLSEMVFGQVHHYWFYRLDYELWKAYRDKAGRVGIWSSLKVEARGLVESFQFRRCSSVEHIDPQTPMEGKPGETLDSFGNLALISGSRNSEFRNLPREGKRQLILASEYTESLKMVHFLWCGLDTVEAGNMMYSLLVAAVSNTLCSRDNEIPATDSNSSLTS